MGQRANAMRMFASLKDAEGLRKLAENVNMALGGLDRAEDLRATSAQDDSLSRMFAALSATNEAIMRAQTREEMFELVCEAAAQGGRFVAATIALTVPGADYLRAVATAGTHKVLRESIRLSVSPTDPEGRGLVGAAFRTREPCIANDYIADERAAGFHDQARVLGVKSGAALLLLRRGETVGVVLFLSAELNAFTPALVELLQRLAESVSFAIENFDRADEQGDPAGAHRR
jgi:GAF domain-containing protein